MYSESNTQNTTGRGPDLLPRAVGALENGPRPSIPSILDEQSSAVTGLHKMISELENRLAQIVSHDLPANDAANRPDPPPPTQIAERLVMHNRGIDLAQQRIGQLMSRLHL